MTTVSKDDWAKIRRLFDELVDLPPSEQQAQMANAGLNPIIAAQLQSLLAASADRGVLDLVPPTIEPPNESPTYSSLSPGALVGVFVVDRLIGRGGMGEVYAAHREGQGFEQRVALKMLRPEAAGLSELFDRERRLLAGLEHPGIARLIDGGIAPDERPYMAMEYVDGQPVDVWCRDHAADLPTRLRLFREICDAVSYAHARLVVHRDLKPSNILVDDSGRVRLLDFGIARMLDESMATGVATQALVTPEYAAPEQLGNSPSTVATDIYALGAILYDLLAGAGPWQSGGASLPSIVRRILHDDPALPSVTASKRQSLVPAAAVKGDLDAIVMRAMRRDPNERYRSAAELGDDVARHQRLEPVHARAGSRRYMVGRFVRRYRWAVAASAAAVVAILIGAGGIALQARQTAIERDVALAEARRSESIVRMLTVMFRDTAESDAGADATVKQMLDQTSERLVGSLDTSAKSAMLVTTLSDLYVNLEDAAGADGLLRQALGKGVGKGDRVATAQMEMRLASTAAALGKTEQMAPLLDRSEAVFATDRQRFRSELVEINSNRAQLLRRTGKLDEAIALLIQTLPAANRVYAENHRDLLTLYNNLLVYMVEANKLGAMPAVFTQADAALKRTGQQNSPQALAIAQLKGVRLLKLDQTERAEAIFERVASERRAVFGKSAGLAVDLLQLGRARMALADYAGAQAAFLEARPMAAENLGAGAVPTLIIGLGLGEALAETGDTARAETMLGEVAPLVAAIPTNGLPHGILARALAITRLKQGRIADARKELDRAESIFRKLGAPGESYLKSFPAVRARIASASQAAAISR